MSFIAEDNYKSAARVREPISAQFIALLGILVLAPLPFGGNRTWALAPIAGFRATSIDRVPGVPIAEDKAMTVGIDRM